jgi:hypothetical protein
MRRYLRAAVGWPFHPLVLASVAAVCVLGVVQPAAFAAGTPPQPPRLNDQPHASNSIALTRSVSGHFCPTFNEVLK